jgi:hypothetical protein
MKKIFALLMLFSSITIFIHAQESKEKKVTIYLVSVQQADTNGVVSNHLLMYDSNGNMAIDNLTTRFEKKAHQKGTIYWEIKCGIKGITAIKAKSWTSIIFGEKAIPELKGNIFKLKLPENRPLPGEEIKEAYAITYITLEGDTVTIDPFIRVLPPPE